MKERIDIARNSRQNRAILINSLYFAAVMQCVRYLKEGEHENQRWVEIFNNSATIITSLCESPEYIVAQTLLKGPLALLDAYVFQESVA